MTAPAPPSAQPSLASGGPLAPVEPGPRSLAQRLAGRVDARPRGIVRSYRGDGSKAARSHAALWREAGDVAAALTVDGVAPASFVVILADDILEFLPAVWGCLRGGFVPVALMAAARDAIVNGDEAFTRLLSRLRSPAILADDHFAARLACLPGLVARSVLPLASVIPASWDTDHPASPDPAWLVATSGSTGQPKLVALSPDALLSRKFAARYGTGLPPHSLGTFPLDSMTGQDVAFLHHDTHTQISPNLLTARPGAILDAIEAHAISEVVLTTSMIRAIMAAETAGRTRSLASLRLVALGAEPIHAGLVQDFAMLLERHGADPNVLVAGYGTTETGSLVGGSRGALSGGLQPACLGPPWHGVTLRVVGDDAMPLPEGETGALEVYSPARMFSGYWSEPALTAAAFTADGWWKTGDLGHLSGGELTLTGRAKDVLIVNGRKLSLAEIDAVVQAALGVGGVGHAYRVSGTATGEEALGIAFDPGRDAAAPEAEAAIKVAVVRRFGIQPQHVTLVPADQVPRTAAGKVRRDLLADIAAGTCPPAPRDPASEADTDAVASRLGAIWREVLGMDRAARHDDRFFDLSGDSLRAVTLDLQVTETFCVRIPSEAFFAEPTFGNLLRLVRRSLDARATPDPAAGTAWALPAPLRLGLAAALDEWPGERLPRHPTILAHHAEGRAAPLLWVFNAPREPTMLAEALGPQQPLYAVRSGVGLIDYREDEIQRLALHYVSEFERLHPSGPVFVGGNCQGGVIALAIAQHLLRRRRHVPLLVLLDWSYALQPYCGRVMMVGCADTIHLNARHLFAHPELAWTRHFAACRFLEIPGGYAEGLLPPQVGLLARTLRDDMAAALAAPPTLLPESAYRASVRAALPARLAVGERRTVRVSVTNRSDVAWASTAASGLVLGSRWVRPGLHGPPQPRASLPGLVPGETATVRLGLVAPATAGEATLVLDLVEEGSRWFGPEDVGGLRAAVHVVSRTSAWPLLLRC